MITYHHTTNLDLDEVIDLYKESTLGARRPIDDRETMQAMIANANLTITAWDDDLLVGIARSVTDFVYAAYLSDLAVRLTHQRQGIGTRLIEETRKRLGEKSKIVLLSAPEAREYYPRIGFTRHESAWLLRAGDELAGGGRNDG